MKEKEKLFKELDKTRKELEKKAEAEKAKKKEAEKVKKEGKKKLSDKGATPPDVSMALEEKVAKYEELYETLRNENEVSGYNHHLKLLHRYMQQILVRPFGDCVEITNFTCQ